MRDLRVFLSFSLCFYYVRCHPCNGPSLDFGKKNPNVEKRHGAARARVLMMTELILRVMGI
jgi:hypothetical protein